VGRGEASNPNADLLHTRFACWSYTRWRSLLLAWEYKVCLVYRWSACLLHLGRLPIMFRKFLLELIQLGPCVGVDLLTISEESEVGHCPHWPLSHQGLRSWMQKIEFRRRKMKETYVRTQQLLLLFGSLFHNLPTCRHPCVKSENEQGATHTKIGWNFMIVRVYQVEWKWVT